MTYNFTSSDSPLISKLSPLDEGREFFAWDAAYTGKAPKLRWWHGIRAGVLIRAGSFWIGIHWSSYNRRACINFIPFVTIWITGRYGNAPGEERDYG
jgi:hypothetical protein